MVLQKNPEIVPIGVHTWKKMKIKKKSIETGMILT